MKIFLSWSGENSQSHQVAQALHNWLPRVIQQAKPWLSSHDMDSGINWGPEVDKQLSEIHFGILVITRYSMLAPWLLFEAGALSKHVERSYVCPYLCGLKATDIEGPLAKLQGRESNKNGTLMLLETNNKALPDAHPLTADVLKDQFEMWWPRLEEDLKAIDERHKPIKAPISKTQLKLSPDQIRSDREILEEILQLARKEDNHGPFSSYREEQRERESMQRARSPAPMQRTRSSTPPPPTDE